MHIPTTSETLLRTIGADASSARWTEFVARYRPMMEAFLASRFPSLASEADDIVQETLVALVKALPAYRYSPGESGAFHNYLTGILHHRACAVLRQRQRAAAVAATAPDAPAAPLPAAADDIVAGRDETAWRQSVFEIALRQLLADESVQERTKQVFSRVAIRGEDAAEVAAAFGLSPNAVAQIRFRMTQRLRDIVAALERGIAPAAATDDKPSRPA